MQTRLDKVTRMLALGFRKVYSLVLTDRGLYIIRTGNVGALKHYNAGDVVGAVVTGAMTNAFVRELQAGEARLASVPLDQLAREKGNAFVPFTEVLDVALKAGKKLEMQVKTAQGNFSFVFTHTPAEQVQALEQALRQGRRE